MNHFHNTLELPFHEADTLDVKAEKMDKHILKVFQANPDKLFTAYDIWNQLNDYEALLTSVRRAITNMTTAGLLEKVDKVAGPYGVKNCRWTVKTLRHD